jgi:GT2 family glycosyltransferase
VSERDPEADDRTAVIIVNYRTPRLTRQCVESVLRSSGVRPRIIVVDNDSRDESVEQLRQLAAANPHVAVHASPINDGYAGGNNIGLAWAHGIGARYALLLNSDAVVDRDCLRLLVRELESDPSVAAVSPEIVFGDEPELLWFGGGRFSLWTGRPIHVGLGQPRSRGWKTNRDMPFASGCALLVRMGALESLGVFDESGCRALDVSLFSYAEDLDLSIRLAAAGYRIRYVPAASVRHYEGASHRRSGGQALRFYLTTRNLVRVMARHARWYHWITLGPGLAVDVVGRYCIVALRDGDIEAFRAVLRGAWHAIVGGRHPIELGANGRSS